MGAKSHRELVEYFAGDLGPKLAASSPSSILVISAHWEASRPTVTTSETPSLLYDYHGFPEETYAIEYPAPHDARLAGRVVDLLGEGGLGKPAGDSERGFDHGVFVPFKMLFPEATVPIVQLSLLSSLDAAQHIEMGRLLAPLRDEGTLIVGSGMTYHNMRGFNAEGGDAALRSAGFDRWLGETLGGAADGEAGADDATEVDDALARLARWREGPFASDCHPREEHLLPLMVAAGAAAVGGDLPGRQDSGLLMGVRHSCFTFGL